MIMRGAMSAYPATLIRGSRLMRSRRGLGNGSCMSGSDFSAMIGPPANCDVHDSACVMCNTQKANAVSNLVDSGCVAPGTPVSFSCDTSPTALTAFMSNNPLAVNATVGTGANATVAAGPTVTMQPPGTSAANYWGGSRGTVAGNPPPNTTTQQTGQNPTSGTSQHHLMTQTTPGWQPRHSRPQIVNPSPPSTLTTTGTSAFSPNSVLNQANGTVPVATATGDWFTDPAQELISGLPNWALLAMAGAGLFLVVDLASRRK